MPLFEAAFQQAMRDRIGPNLNLTLTEARRSLISVRRRGAAIDVRIARYFVYADESVVAALADYICGTTKKFPQSARLFAEQLPPAKETVAKARRNAKPKGRRFNLKTMADEIDRKYFGGELRAVITWGAGASQKKRRSKNAVMQLGSYCRDLDLIRVHPALDQPFVSEAYVGLVIYHEMLHKHMGTTRRGDGKRSLHGPTFRAAERAFEEYDEAMQWERNNFGKLLASRGRPAT